MTSTPPTGFELQVIENLSYGDDVSHVLDLYLPSTPSPPPVVLYLHGGGFQRGDKADNVERVRSLAAHGFAVASANYRLAPAITYPGPVTDAKQAVAWLRRNADQLGLDARKLGVWGASAGAYLASMVGLTASDAQLTRADDAGLDHVDAVVAWFGVFDLLASTSRSWLEQRVLPPSPEAILLGPGGGSRESLMAASPIFRVCDDAPPFLVAHGDADQIIPVRQSTALHDALVRQGVPSTLTVVGGAGHEAPEFDAATHLGMTAAFLTSTLESPAGER